MRDTGLERAAMRGRLAELENTGRALTLRIEGLAAAIRTGLNTALTPVKDLDVPLVAQQMNDLELAFAELLGTNGQIERLNKELF